jgi:hypothetical protein
MGRAQADRNFSEELCRLKRFWRVIPPLLRVVDAAAVALYPSALEVAERARLFAQSPRQDTQRTSFFSAFGDRELWRARIGALDEALLRHRASRPFFRGRDHADWWQLAPGTAAGWCLPGRRLLCSAGAVRDAATGTEYIWAGISGLGIIGMQGLILNILLEMTSQCGILRRG